MLTQLVIQDFAIIESLTLDLHNGMTTVTGETGAGKSIIIDAVEIALGQRADTGWIRHGSEKCDITAAFQLGKNENARAWLQENELDNDDECLIRRVIHANGRSKSFINGTPVTLHQVKQLRERIINIHAQHSQQLLLNTQGQRQLFDAYANHGALLEQVKNSFNQWQSIQHDYDELVTKMEQGDARETLLRYQVDELEKLALLVGEVESLHQEHKQLTHGDRLGLLYQDILSSLNQSEEQTIESQLHQMTHKLLEIHECGVDVSQASELLNSAIIQLQECAADIQYKQDTLDINPQRLREVENRLELIHDIARKHHVEPEALTEHHIKLAQELQALCDSEQRLLDYQQEIAQLRKEYDAFAKKLSDSRKKAAKPLAKTVEASIQQLGMPKGQFSVQFSEAKQPTSHGLDNFEFYVCANPGQPMQPLTKVASGGELSRISLAIQVLTAQQDVTPCLIFDEVDVGIGGATAEIVGQLLRQLAKQAQVLCITHLPQVASQGHHHLYISKETQDKTTHSNVIYLDKAQRIEEIARMLGGVKITKQTLAHAEEMCEGIK